MQLIIAVVTAVGASSGFWAWFMSRTEKKSTTKMLLMGLAHERIMTLGMSYLKKKWISKEEYEEFHKYLYEPYAKSGGNGLAEKIMNDLGKLPFEDPKKKKETINEND